MHRRVDVRKGSNGRSPPRPLAGSRCSLNNRGGEGPLTWGGAGWEINFIPYFPAGLPDPNVIIVKKTPKAKPGCL